MGSGEGAQAYGWGLYFADSKKVGEWYREGLSQQIHINGELLTGNNRRGSAYQKSPIESYLDTVTNSLLSDTKADSSAYAKSIYNSNKD